jgi:uncharacterized pyridoxamine 5'-phosphate oxidase family protein
MTVIKDKEEIKMQQVIDIVKECGYGFLATVELGKPRVRPFGFMFEEDGKLYFCTNSQKDVYKQLLEQPLVEYAATTRQMVTARITGEVVFTEAQDKKEKALASSEMVKQLYKSAENPVFKVFFIEHGTAVIADFSGKPPRVVEF